jgi:hypothetical protein
LGLLNAWTCLKAVDGIDMFDGCGFKSEIGFGLANGKGPIM